MSVQGGNAIDHGFAYAGMVADLQLCNGVSKLNKGPDNIPYGSGVVTDGEDGAALPSPVSTPSEFVGVVKYELNRAHLDSAPDGATPLFDMTVVTFGVIWVKVLDTVAKDASVYLRVGATGNGEFSGVVGAAATLGILIPNARFLTAGDAGDLVKISLGLGG